MCWYCEKKDHRASDCRKSQHEESPKESTTKLLRYHDTYICCFARDLVPLWASTTQAFFVLRFPCCGGFPTCSLSFFLKGIAASNGTSNFLRAAFIVSLTSSSFGPMKNIPLTCQALSSFGFSKDTLGYLSFSLHQTCLHVSGHTSSGREIVCFLASLLPDHVLPSVGLFFQWNESCESCPCLT